MAPVPTKTKTSQKRKRDHPEDPAAKIAASLRQAVKNSKKSSKKAKDFEIRKLVKKLRDARQPGKDADVETLERQLEIAKGLDHERIGLQALRTKLKKDSALRNRPDVQDAIAQELPPEVKPAFDLTWRQLLIRRLLSSKTLAGGIAESLRHLHIAAGLQVVSNATPSLNPNQSIGDAEDDSAAEDAEDEDEDTENDKNIKSEEDGHVGIQSDKDSDEAADEDKEMGAGEAWSGIGEGGLQSDGDDSDLSGDDDDGDDDSDIDSPPRKQRKPALPYGMTADPGSSTFLPALSVGFVRGDSDASDIDDPNIDGPQKKNRRGQRARKAIWEKKYGRNANHIKKAREEATQEGARNSYRTARGGHPARGRGDFRGRGGFVSRGGRAGPEARAGGPMNVPWMAPQHAPEPRPIPPPKESKPLHPSWEAKKKLKEQHSATIVPAQGTKLKFS